LVNWLHTQPIVVITAHVHPAHAASIAVAAAAGLAATDERQDGEVTWRMRVG
jgi:RimJ/RimL family protein N-acetyltransferase